MVLAYIKSEEVSSNDHETIHGPFSDDSEHIRLCTTSWYLCQNQAEVMEADHENLIFVDDMERDDVLIEFDKRYPADQPEMTLLDFGRSSNCGTSNFSNFPQKIRVFEYSRYDDGDAEVAARFAQAAPDGCVAVSHEHVYRPGSHYDNTYHGYMKIPSKLNEHGCYVRFSKQKGRYEVVYNPKIAANRMAAVEKHNSKLRKKKEGALLGTGHIQIHEFGQLCQELANNIGNLTSVPMSCYGWGSRARVLACLKRLLILFQIIYGKNSHRRVPAFQKFKLAWRARSTLTKRAFGSGRAYADEVPFFAWLDREAKAAKPRNNTLSPRMDRSAFQGLSESPN